MTKDNYDITKIGGKAANLAKLTGKFPNIPQWFALSTDAYSDYQKDKINTEQIIKQELEQALVGFDNTLFAVRSSIQGEDGKNHSFAGQFETYLNVTREDIFAKILLVWQSTNADRVKLYQKQNKTTTFLPAVLIQAMVNADYAGVAFAVNPINANVKQTLVSAVTGLGDKLVDGSANAYNYIVENDTIIESAQENVLSDNQVLTIAKLTHAVSKHFSLYQDIEWAIADDKLYLLQSRAITTLKEFNAQSGTVNLFDNSNIAESYNGITSPLTFSFIRFVYEEVYRQMCIVFGVKKAVLEANNTIFANMLAIADGQVYYNMISWYKLIAILPGYQMNREFMETMMGVKEELPANIRSQLPVNDKGKLANYWDFISSIFTISSKFLQNEKSVKQFFVLLEETLAEKDLSTYNLYELSQYFHFLESKLLKKWDAPVANDFFAMIFYGLLKKLSKEWLAIDDETDFNSLLSNTGDIISALPAKLVKEMATSIKEDKKTIDLLLTADNNSIANALPEHLKAQVNAYLEQFADRCINELKLESKTLGENPLNLYRAIGSYALKLSRETSEDNKTSTIVKRTINEAELMKNLSFTRKIIFKFVLKNARITIKNRENLRFERTRLFGRTRQIFKQAGIILASFNQLETADDIFYLEVNEVLNFIEGKSTTNNLKALATLRKEEYQGFQNNIADRFETYGCVNLSKKHIKNTTIDMNLTDENSIKGLPCCAGIVRGIARVITNPNNANLKAGEILVAQRTDPGWIMLFPLASAVLVEYGSLLSHAAIVVREMSIPAIVSVPNLFEWINDGDEIEINGETGIIRRITKNDEK